MKYCDRCGEGAEGWTTRSMFDIGEICMDCKKEDREHPAYARAEAAEAAAFRAGYYNFPGIGLPADLKETKR